jgi:hypothetical protein
VEKNSEKDSLKLPQLTKKQDYNLAVLSFA